MCETNYEFMFSLISAIIKFCEKLIYFPIKIHGECQLKSTPG